MQKITLLCIGSLKSTWIREGCTDFVARLTGLTDLQTVELPASRSKDPQKQCAEESERLLDVLKKRSGVVWALDERGKGMTSEEFAQALEYSRDEGQEIIFILGGAYGLSDDIRAKADQLIRLSVMTFPHELCRVVFLEQLYRAMQISRGSGYHH